MAARFKLQPDPTFQASVLIPIPGAAAAPVVFVFKYRDRTELQQLLDRAGGLEDVPAILEMCQGWDLADAFTPEAVTTLVRNYVTAPALIWEKYLDELTRIREKN